MKLNISQLKQLIKEELQTALREEDDKIAAILSEFTPEEQEILRKDTGNLERTMQIELDRLGDPAKLIKLMRSIIAHGSYDARSAAKEAEKEERRRAELSPGSLVEDKKLTKALVERCGRVEKCEPEELAENHWFNIKEDPMSYVDWIKEDYDGFINPWCNGAEEKEGYGGNLETLPWLRELSPDQKKEFGCGYKRRLQDLIADGLQDPRQIGEEEWRVREIIEGLLRHIGGEALIIRKENKKINQSQLKDMIKETLKKALYE